MRNTSEPPAILPEGAVSGDTHALLFDADASALRYPAYDALAEKALARLAGAGAAERRLRNAEAQLERGRVLGDFLLPEETCLRRAQQGDPKERDYWIAMLLLAREAARYVAASPESSLAFEPCGRQIGNIAESNKRRAT
jgi:hypothetical protein